MMKMTFYLACSLVLGGAAVLSVSSCDKYDDKQSVRETPAAKQVDGQWQTPEETDALLADAGVTRVNEDYFKGKLPADPSSVIGGFVLNPSGLTVEASTSGKETRLACTVTGTTLSLADVTPQDSTFYEVNAQYGWKKEVKYKNSEARRGAVRGGAGGRRGGERRRRLGAAPRPLRPDDARHHHPPHAHRVAQGKQPQAGGYPFGLHRQ